MSGPPRLSLHVGDYLKDTPPISRVNWEHHGIYLLGMMTAWSVPGCRLPNDPKWLAERFGCTVDEYREHVEPVLLRYFKKKRSWLYQKRLSKEHVFATKQSEKQSQNAKSRWNKEKTASDGTTVAKPKIQSGNAPLSPSLSIEKRPPQPPKGDYPAEFENQIWEPLAGAHDEMAKAGSKRKAFEAWQKACKRSPAEQIAEGARLCAERYSRPPAKDEFRPYPKMVVTWLNGDCWELEGKAQPPPDPLSPAARARIAELEAEDAASTDLHRSRREGPDSPAVGDVVDENGERGPERQSAGVGAAVRGLGCALRA